MTGLKGKDMITKEFYEKYLRGKVSVSIRDITKPYVQAEFGYVEERKNNKLYLVWASKDLPLEYDLVDSYYAECMGCGVDKVLTEKYKNGNYEITLWLF